MYIEMMLIFLVGYAIGYFTEVLDNFFQEEEDAIL